MDYDLRQLRYFVTIAEAGIFSKTLAKSPKVDTLCWLQLEKFKGKHKRLALFFAQTFSQKEAMALGRVSPDVRASGVGQKSATAKESAPSRTVNGPKVKSTFGPKLKKGVPR